VAVLCVALLATSGAASARLQGDVDPAAERNARLEWVGPLSDLHRQVAHTLREQRQDANRGQEHLSQLLAPGLGAVAPLLDILVQERVPRAQPDDAPQLLSASQRALLLSALAKLPAERVRAEFDRRMPKPPAPADPRLRLAALRVLSAIGKRSDLEGISPLAPRQDGQLDAATEEALRAAYVGILRRDPEALEEGMDVLRTCDQGAAKQFLFALADLGDTRALPLLDQCARSIPELAQQAISILPRVGPSGDAEFDLALASWLTDKLDPGRVEWTRASLRAIGVLDDGSHAPALIELLDSPKPALREAALGALQQQSGLRLGPSTGAWREWYARESGWQTSGRQAALEAFASGQDALVAQALGACAELKLHKDQRAADVLTVLEQGSPAMRILACRTLVAIGSTRAIAPLLEHFADEDEALSEAAWRAACTLAKKPLSRNSREAHEQLAGS
jgi:hypothetical protein